MQQLGGPSIRYAWAASVCKNRDHFTHSIFRFRLAGADETFLFLYALQQPHIACFVKVDAVEVVDHAQGDALRPLRDASLYQFDHNFQVDFSRFRFSDRRFVDPACDVDVLLCCCLRPAGIVVSDDEWASFDSVARSFQPAAAAVAEVEGPNKKVEPDPISEQPLWVTYPWLLEDWHSLGAGASKGGKKVADDLGSEPGLEDAGDSDDDGFGGLSVDVLLAELTALRADLHGDRLVADFKVSLRGGAWTAANRGGRR